MRKRIIPVNKLKLFGNEKFFLNRCIDEKWISSAGPIIDEFEKKFSRIVKRKYATTVSNGTVALELAVQSLKLKPGDEIILPAFTIISCCNAIIKNKLKPVLVDCDPNTWNMDSSQIEKKITKNTKAIMLVHLYGLTPNINEILIIAKKYNLKIIEDAAEAVGQYYYNKPCGSFGDISTFSFYANKHLTTGEGGMILTNNKSYYERILKFKNLCFGKDAKRFFHTDIGSNYRMTSFQAAFGLSQLKNLNKIIEIKISLGLKYNNLLKRLNKCLQLPLVNTKFCKNHYWVYGLVLKRKIKFDNTYIIEKLKKKGIICRPFFASMSLQPIYKKLGYFKKNNMNCAEYLSKKGFYVPSGVGTTNEQIKKVSKEIISIFKKFNV
jgi:perosamine synthetase